MAASIGFSSAASSAASGSGSGSGSAGHATLKKSLWGGQWYHWLYLRSCRTKFRACGAYSMSPSITTRATDFPSASISFTSGVWHTSASSVVPAGIMAEGGMSHTSGICAVATPQWRTRSAAESVSTVTRKEMPLDWTSTLTA